jgi:hypothetical protein
MRKLDCDIDEGWVVHVYGRDRRLLCSLEPSHGWIFIIGLAMGLILGLGLAAASLRSEPPTRQSPSLPAPMEPPLSVD